MKSPNEEESPKPKSKLQPCPFCGEKENLSIQTDYGYLDTYKVVCQPCSKSKLSLTKEEAIRVWNKREIELCNVCSNTFCDWCCKYGGKTDT